ncbi:uncharacterized protein PRCAT00001978001 [Priceomyces carsonii]|uniref:uncharacterized protein n=1 Tax=Priceomyces carsonii TaxID=28549 RepID=UPI002EDA0DF4|nr:unnamed protein product [Priceomyces carsonii]
MIGARGRWVYVLTALSWFITFINATTTCNSTHSCPESSPCCNAYGECGTGVYCLGGCDVRYSYNLTACMPMPRMSDFEVTFDKKSILSKQSDYLGNYSETDWLYSGYTSIHDDALLLQMPNQSSGTVISSTKYLWYGKVSAQLKTSHDKGVVTAFILFSDVQDEIDFEFVGFNLTYPQSNYYALGILDYDNAKASKSSNTFKNYHEYTVDWQEDKIDWYVDDSKVRTLNKSDTWNKTTKRYDFPQTPSRIQVSLWPGGDSSNGLGTIEWAGGKIDWDSSDIKKYGYYYAYLKNITVEQYDLPDGVKLEGADDESDLHAYLYNSTKAGQNKIVLTSKKTWLGSEDATGIDPDNSDDESDSTKSSSSLKSNKSSSTNTSKTTTGTSGKTEAAKTTATTYNTNGAIGGFVQNTGDSAASSTSDSSKSGSSSSGGDSQFASSSKLQKILLAATALAIGTSAFMF